MLSEGVGERSTLEDSIKVKTEMNALELIEEAERVGYALGVTNSDSLSEFTQWVITLRWPKIIKVEGDVKVESSTMEDLRVYFPTVKQHPKNAGAD